MQPMYISIIVALLSYVQAFIPRTTGIIGSCGVRCNIPRADLKCFAKARKKENKKSSAPDDDEDEINIEGFSDEMRDMLLSAKEVEMSLSDLQNSPMGIDLEDTDEMETEDSDEESDDDLRKYVQEITGIFAEMDDESANQDFVTSPDDIVDTEEDQDSIPNVAPTDDWRDKVGKIIHEVIRKQDLYVQKIYWLGGRVEVVISASSDPLNPIGPSVSALQVCHRSMYEEFELREEELAVVTKFEIVVASPGIGEVLRSDQDFISFKGFTVAVTTTEIYKKKTLFEGTLVERSEDSVCISLKGRIAKIPRELVSEVRLPKPKYESTDTEMRKLRR